MEVEGEILICRRLNDWLGLLVDFSNSRPSRTLEVPDNDFLVGIVKTPETSPLPSRPYFRNVPSPALEPIRISAKDYLRDCVRFAGDHDAPIGIDFPITTRSSNATAALERLSLLHIIDRSAEDMYD